eukprot:g3131.t1
MEERISLRPMSNSTRLGPSTDFFSEFRKGAGKHLRSTNRDNQWDNNASKRPEDRIRYSRTFLEHLKELFRELPQSVNAQISCFKASEESWTKRDQLVTDAEEGLTESAGAGGGVPIEPNWRSKTQTNDKTPVLTEQSAIPAPLPADGAKVGQLQKAEELGREAYRPRSSQNITDVEKNTRQVNGILNKLTPNNFERLLNQVTELITNAEVLRKSISLVFEKAVAEPTFCALYAELCERLSTSIPDFPPLEGERQKLTFRRILLNTCQDEFEGVENSRKLLETVEDAAERELAEKKVKDRTLGNMRLIAELFNKGLVAEKIMHSCLVDLLQTESGVDLPHEDNLEAVCEVLTLAGKKFSDSQRYSTHLSAFISRLERFSKTRAIPSRISFLIQDVVDMQSNNWIPRREKFTAKKIEEIHTEAEKELGIQIKMALPKTSTAISSAVTDDELFPTPQRFHKEGEWKAVANRLSKAPAPAPTPVKPAPVINKKEYKTNEDREKATQSMFKEYLSSADKKEAGLCVDEICSSSKEHAIELMSSGLKIMFDCVTDRDHTMLIELLIWLCSKDQSLLSKDSFLLGLKTITDQLDDLVLDIPKSPELCGKLLGKAVKEGVAEIQSLPSLCASILGAEARRPFALGVFMTLKSEGIDVGKLCRDHNLHLKRCLEAKENFDMPDLESVEEFLKKTGFSKLPL